MKIKFVEPAKEYFALEREIDCFLKRIFRKGHFILGDEVKIFEREFARFCNVRYAIGVNSGTDALRLALQSLKIGRDDEVITTPFTFVATVESILHTGALPAFVDIDEHTFTLSNESLISFLDERVRQGIDRITKRRVRCVIPIHIFGNPCNMGEIMGTARKYRLFVVEDSAQAHGSEMLVDGRIRKTGSMGDLGCFSFYPTKSLGCAGDGGMITTNRASLASKCYALRNHGRDAWDRHRIPGWNSRLDEIQAGILRIKLKRVKKWNRERKKVVKMYSNFLKGIGDIRFMKPEGGSNPIYLAFPVLTAERTRLREYLLKNGIETKVYYEPPLHKLPYFSDRRLRGAGLKNAEKISKEILCLPVHPFLKDTEVEYICDVIKRFFKK